MANFYERLKLNNFASIEEVKASYVKLSRIYHPDRNDDPDAEWIFIEINHAYEVLGKPQTKKQYDHALRNGYEYEFESYGPSADIGDDPVKVAQMFLDLSRKAVDDLKEIRIMVNSWPLYPEKFEYTAACEKFESILAEILDEFRSFDPSTINDTITDFNKCISDLAVFYSMTQNMTAEFERKAELKEEEAAEWELIDLLEEADELEIDEADEMDLDELKEAIAEAQALKLSENLPSDIKDALEKIELASEMISSVEWDEVLSGYKAKCETDKKYLESKLKSLENNDKLLSMQVMENIRERIESIESLARKVEWDTDLLSEDPQHFVEERRKEKEQQEKEQHYTISSSQRRELGPVASYLLAWFWYSIFAIVACGIIYLLWLIFG